MHCKSNGFVTLSLFASSKTTRPFSSLRISMIVCIKRDDNSSASANKKMEILFMLIHQRFVFFWREYVAPKKSLFIQLLTIKLHGLSLTVRNEKKKKKRRKEEITINEII